MSNSEKEQYVINFRLRAKEETACHNGVALLAAQVHEISVCTEMNNDHACWAKAGKCI